MLKKKSMQLLCVLFLFAQSWATQAAPTAGADYAIDGTDKLTILHQRNQDKIYFIRLLHISKTQRRSL